MLGLYRNKSNNHGSTCGHGYEPSLQMILVNGVLPPSRAVSTSIRVERLNETGKKLQFW